MRPVPAHKLRLRSTKGNRENRQVPARRSGSSHLDKIDFRNPPPKSSLETLNWLTTRGAKVICATHLGRPKGKPVAKYSLDPIRKRLNELAPDVTLL